MLRVEANTYICVTKSLGGDYGLPLTFYQSALIDCHFLLRDRETRRKCEVWPYGMWNCNLPQQVPRYIQMMEESKIPIPWSLVAGGYCFVKGTWHNQPCKCVWCFSMEGLSRDSEEGLDSPLFDTAFFFFLPLSGNWYLSQNKQMKKPKTKIIYRDKQNK